MNRIAIGKEFGPYCMSSAQGAALYDQLKAGLDAHEAVELDFADVSILIASFLNASLAKLYGDFPQDVIAKLVSFRNVTPAHVNVIQAVVDNAKRYYYDETYRKAQEEALRKMFE